MSKTIRVRQHIPAFVDGIAQQSATVATQDELLALPWVKQWADDPDHDHFALSDGRYLMAVQNGGRTWWVVAYVLDGADALSLREWRAHAKA